MLNLQFSMPLSMLDLILTIEAATNKQFSDMNSGKFFRVSLFTYEEHSRRFSKQIHSQQQENLQSVQVKGSAAGRRQDVKFLQRSYVFVYSTSTLAWMPDELSPAHNIWGREVWSGIAPLGRNYARTEAVRTNHIVRAGFIRWWTDDQQ